MKVLCILLCVTLANGFYIDNNGTHEEKIQGGDYVTIDDVPYLATLHWYRGDIICSATIIDASWVITTAHCVHNLDYIHLSVRTGTGFRHHFGKEHRVERIIIHRDYDPYSKINDIALIKLAMPIRVNNEQQPIEPAKPHDIPREGELMRISGFGQRGEQLSEPDILKAAYVPVMNQALCERIYRLTDVITDDMFCAGNGEANACPGDSGGPGIIHGKLYGVISCGRIFGSGIYPSVYTKVHKYYHWIEEKTGLRF